MTDLWMVRIDRPMRQAESEALLALLPQERRNRLHGHALEKQPEVLCAYGLLLALLRKRCGWQGFPAVARNAEDKPFFPAYPGVCFSISHTEGAAAAAVAETSIGVDIQRIQTPPRRLARLTGTDDRMHFSAAGCGWKPAPSEPGREFCTSFMRKLPQRRKRFILKSRRSPARLPALPDRTRCFRERSAG